MREGTGCEASYFSKEEQEGKIVFDQFYGEHATCFNVKDRGLVVISSCGHRGIISSIRQAQAVSGVQKVHAAMGGFHLGPAPEPYIAQTVQTLKEIDPDYVIPMHCTGRAASGWRSARCRTSSSCLILERASCSAHRGLPGADASRKRRVTLGAGGREEEMA